MSAPGEAGTGDAGTGTPGPGEAGSPGTGGAGLLGGTGGGVPAVWTDGMDDAAKGYVENKGWTGPVDLLKGYQALEGMQGVPPEQLVKLPASPDDEAGWGEVHAKLGRPESGEKYDFEGVENPEGTTDLMPVFREWAHKFGLNQKQARGIVELFNANTVQTLAGAEEKANEQAEADIQALRGSWGAAYDENIQAGKKAAQRFGIDGDTLGQIEGALGTRVMLELMAKIGRGFGEHRADIPAADGTPFGMTPAAAKAQIDKLKLDKDFMALYMGGNKEAVERWTQLHRLGFPDAPA